MIELRSLINKKILAADLLFDDSGSPDLIEIVLNGDEILHINGKDLSFTHIGMSKIIDSSERFED